MGIGGAGLGLYGGRRLGAADFDLLAMPDERRVAGRGITREMLCYGEAGPPPLIRLRQGEDFELELDNRLPEATTVHWHGLRVDNAEDGVPFLTQAPVEPGERWRYRLCSNDAGTFWYHPHCNTLEQIARGLCGLLVVDEDTPPDFDADVPLLLRDFRLDEQGQFISLFEARRAARGGTLGTVTTVNWRAAPTIEVPSGGLVRLRLANVDVTRTYALSLDDAACTIVALDGHPLPADVVLPSPGRESLLLGAGQRADIALAVPATPGRTVTLMRAAPTGPTPIARFRAVGRSRARRLRDRPTLVANPVSSPRPERAETLSFDFSWAPGREASNADICGTLGYTFWAINKTAGVSDTSDTARPLAELESGKHYVLRLRNRTPQAHPIHLHGMTFRLLRSTRRAVPPLYTDTALLQEGETLDIALVADNPGDWAFHCHIIEHQKTGLTGFLRVRS